MVVALWELSGKEKETSEIPQSVVGLGGTNPAN